MLYLLACSGPHTSASPDTGTPAESAGLTDSVPDTAPDSTPPPDSGDDTGAPDTGAPDTGAPDTGPRTTLTNADIDLSGTCTSTTVLPCDASGCTFTMDLRTYAWSGSLRLDGAPVPGGWLLVLEDADSVAPVNETYHLPSDTMAEPQRVEAEVSGSTWSAKLPEGNWNIYLEREITYDTREWVQVAAAFPITAAGTLDVDVSRYAVGLALTLDGVAPTGALDAVRYHATETTTGEEWYSDAASGSYTATAMLPAGTWDVTVNLGGMSGFADGEVPFTTGLVVSADTSLVLDLTTATVSGAVTFNGHTIDEYTSIFYDSTGWMTTLTDRADGTVYRTQGTGGTWSARLPVGAYDVALSSYSIPATVMLSPLELVSDTAADLDMTLYEVSGTIEWNGVPLERYPGILGSSSLFWATGRGTYTGWLPEGVFDFMVAVPPEMEDGHSFAASWVAATDVVVVGDTTVDISLSSTTVSGNVSLGGAAIEAAEDWDWAFELYFEDPETGAYALTSYDYLGTPLDTWSVDLPPGTWNVYFLGNTPLWSGRTLGKVAEGFVTPPPGPVDIEIAAHPLTIDVTRDGAPIATDAGLGAVPMAPGVWDRLFGVDSGSVPVGTWPAGAYTFAAVPYENDDPDELLGWVRASCVEIPL